MKYPYILCTLFSVVTISAALPLPQIGKTHFIMGDPQLYVPQPLSLLPAKPPKELQVLFSSEGTVRARLLQLINNEKIAIYVAVFMITDPEVANALCAARKRGVLVEVVTDVGCLKDRASKVTQLEKNGCAVYIYNPTKTKKGTSLMHHKFALFANNNNKLYIWTGSYNFTKAANNINCENVVIFSDKQAYDKFLQEFRKLKSKSYYYTHEKIVTL